MNIYFVSSPFDCQTQVEKNLQRAYEVFPQVEHFESQKPIAETYHDLCKKSAAEKFVWIDADNFLFAEAKSILDQDQPSILLTKNEYGIIYGHGGVKLCATGIRVPESAIDVSYYLQLQPVNTIGSFHELGSDWLKYRGIFVEMTKLALRGDLHRLQMWTQARPDIWLDVEKTLHKCNIHEIKSLIKNRSSFKDYYESCLHSPL